MTDTSKDEGWFWVLDFGRDDWEPSVITRHYEGQEVTLLANMINGERIPVSDLVEVGPPLVFPKRDDGREQ